MKTASRPQLAKRTFKLAGGIDQATSTWTPEGGWYSLIGAHGNDLNALTKWAGSQLWTPNPLNGRVTGLFQTILASVQSYVLMAGGNIYRSADGTSIQTLLTGETPAYYDGRTIGSMFFMVSGVNPNRKLLSNLTVQTVGIAPPVLPPTVTLGAAGVLNGGYLYLYTYKNSLSNAESNQSTATAVINPVNKVVQVQFAAPTDSTVDRIVLYRTQNNGSVFQKVVEQAATVLTYTDNIPDAQLGITVPTANDVPPRAKYLELYNGMLLWTGLASPFQNRVMPSGVLLPEAVSQFNTYDLDPEDNDQITGIRKFGQAVAVYKNNGLFLGTGTSPDTMNFVRTRVVEGALGNWGIIALKSAHIYFSQKGPHQFTGLQEDYFGRQIEPIYKGLDQTALANASGVYYRRLNMLIWNVQTAGLPDFDTWLIFNMITKEWTTKQYASSRLSTFLDSKGQTNLWIGAPNGQVLIGDIGNADNGVPIVMDGITRGICLQYTRDGSPDLDQLYCFRHITIWYDNNPLATAVVTVSFTMDDPRNPYTLAVNASTGAIGTFLPAGTVRTRFDIPQQNSYGRLMFIRIQSTSTDPLKIRGIHAEGLPLGRF